MSDIKKNEKEESPYDTIVDTVVYKQKFLGTDEEYWQLKRLIWEYYNAVGCLQEVQTICHDLYIRAEYGEQIRTLLEQAAAKAYHASQAVLKDTADICNATESRVRTIRRIFESSLPEEYLLNTFGVFKNLKWDELDDVEVLDLIWRRINQ